MAKPTFRLAEVATLVAQTRIDHVLEIYPLDVVPNPFARVQLRRVARQALLLQPLGCILRREDLDHVAAMDRHPIPGHQELPTQMAA